MKVKIDTKEKFSVVTPQTSFLNDNFAEQLLSGIENKNSSLKTNIILNLSEVEDLTQVAAEMLNNIQQQYYNDNFSLVICSIKKPVEAKLEQWGFLEMMNTTPTESEAGDIILMEEIERELLNDENNFEG